MHTATATAATALTAFAAFAAPAIAGIPQSVYESASGSTIRIPHSPNILLIVTDDQGFAELGVTGNPVVRTPNIDRFASQSTSLANFHVMPVCSPTRACLMSGRYYYRTGLTDTWMGNSLMDPSTKTIAQILADAGYRTGIFGKWHLGDTYPRRAMDKGFQESLVLNGGGLAQPGDPPDPVDERGAYFNATMRHNGEWIKTDGYVSDVITTAAMRFIEQNTAQHRDTPFFVYLPFNCPHSPHQVPDEYRRHYPPDALAPAKFPKSGNPMSAKQNTDDIARVYGMVENIDDNVARILAKLDELKIANDTIVVLFSDNGCQQHNGYNGGLRGWKGSPFEGGIHQFCFIRWPGQFKAGAQVTPITSVIDITPTLIDLAGVPVGASLATPASGNQTPKSRVASDTPTERQAAGRSGSSPIQNPKSKIQNPFDGLSLAPLLRGDDDARARAAAAWPDRALFFQWHRGDAPERYRAMAVRTQNWKLVQPLGGRDGKTDFMLFDMTTDPYEQHNLAAQHPDQVAALKKAYDAWFDSIMRSHDFSKPQRLTIGAPQENPVLLTRQDWRGPKANWNANGHGYWELIAPAPARYDMKIRFDALKKSGDATITYSGSGGGGRITQKKTFAAGDTELIFKNIALPAGDGRLEVTLKTPQAERGVTYVELTRLE